jgi:hypothetical protein
MKGELLLAGPARRALERMPAADRHRVPAVLDVMELDPFSGDIVRLKAQSVAWRHARERRAGPTIDLFLPQPDERVLLCDLLQVLTASAEECVDIRFDAINFCRADVHEVRVVG